jgi:hypothetical protein
MRNMPLLLQVHTTVILNRVLDLDHKSGSINRIRILANIRRISELGFDSIRIRFGRIRISVSELEFEFGELYTLFQNSDSPNIREYEFELGEFFPTPGTVVARASQG